MNEFDRIFQRDDVNWLGFVDLVEKGGQRRRLAAAGRAGDQNQAGFFLGDLLENRRQSETLERRDFAFELPHHDREMSLLPENIDAETRFVAERVTAIAGAAGEVIVNQAAIALHEGERDLLRLIRSERFDRRIDKDRLQFAEVFHLERMADGEIEIGDAVVGLQHRGQNFVEIGYSHGQFILPTSSAGGSFRNGAEFLLVDRLVVSFFRARCACCADDP